MNKYKCASEQGRLAMIPDWMQEGNFVYLWDSVDCLDESCGDEGKLACPMGKGSEQVIRRCRMAHPVLRRIALWSVVAQFTPRGVLYFLNDFYVIPDVDLLRIVFKNEKEARLHKPLEAIF